MVSPCPWWVLCSFLCTIPSLLTAALSLLLPRAQDVHPWMLAWKIPAPCRGEGRKAKQSQFWPCPAPLALSHHMDSLSVMSSTARRQKAAPGMFLLSKYSRDDGSCLESKPNIRAPEPLRLSRTPELQQQLLLKKGGECSSSVTEASVPWWLQRGRDLSEALLVCTAKSS